MRRAIAGILAAAGVLSCERAPVEAFIGLPIGMGAARSAVLAVAQGETYTLHAIDLSAEQPLYEGAFAAGEAGSFELVTYDAPLRDLRLVTDGAGVIQPADAGDAEAELTLGAGVFFLDLGRDTEWRVQPRLSDRLRSARVKRTPKECASLDPVPLDDAHLLPLADVAFLVPDGPDAVLVGFREPNAIYRVTAAGEITLVPVTPPLAPHVGFDDGRGSLWVATYSGALFRSQKETPGTFSREGTIVKSGSPDEETHPFRIGGIIEGDRQAIFVLDDTVSGMGVQRFAGGAFTVLGRFDDVSDLGGVFAISPDEVLAVIGNRDYALQFKNGSVTRLPILLGTSGFMTMAEVPGIGLLVGGLAQIARRTNDGFERLGDPPIDLAITAIAPHLDGFLFGGTYGFISQYRLSSEYCDSKQPVNFNIRHIVPMGDRVAVGGVLRRDDILPFAILSGRP